MNTLIDNFLVLDAHKESSLKWELLKNEIKSFTNQFCTVKNQNSFSEEKVLLNNINETNKLLTINPEDSNLQETLKTYKQNYEILSMHKTRGAQIRCRTKYIEEGERNTKYFLGLEKVRGSQNTVKVIRDNNNSLTDPEDILNKIRSFYADLYSHDINKEDDIESIQKFLNEISFPVLNDEESLNLEDNFSILDLSHALTRLNNDSAPGSDGLTVSFYNFFWCKLKIVLYDSLTNAFESGELSVSQRRGIITLAHKGDNLDKDNLSNWRPITLLNTDYKIFSKIIAIRLQSVITKIIHPLQKGFIKGRNITEIIRLIDDTILVAGYNKVPGLMVSVDFQKAFDSVNKTSILNALQTFKFGPNIIKAVSLLLNKS